MNWKTGAAILLALIVGLATLFRIATRLPVPPEHQVFINGEVITMDADNRVVQALSVRGDRIEAAGNTADIMALVTSSTEVVDLAGGTLLPGFIDAHGHFPGSGLNTVAADLNSPPIGNTRDIPQLLAVLAELAAVTPTGDWVSGFGYDDTALAEGRHPTREELDAVSAEHPVALLHISGHMVVANSMALAAVGIDETTPNPEGGVIARDSDTGALTGLLEETARLAVVEKILDLGVIDMF
ncbi:MAG TPA: amidohydrolase family protein, partial [Kineobactrum sp.]